ncbi:MAG: FHA domain-containing protein, partial [Bdellovibrionales bacterium]|nr:FHA domain-containing protein [Bdellovibrionales bacterium]
MKQPVVLRIFFNEKLEGVKQFVDAQIVIGRNADVQVDLQEEGVSPLHALIEERDNGYYISDLGSQTGTLLNGQKVLDEAIQSGDEIKIGSYKIQFFVGIPKPVTPPTPVKPTPAPQPSVPPVQAPVPTPTPKFTPVQPLLKTEPQVAKKATPPPLASNDDTEKIETPAPTPKIPKESVSSGSTKPDRRQESLKSFQAPVKPSKKTFAPVSIKAADEILKPGKGTVIEVSVAWKERIIQTHHFNEKGVVTIGSSEKSNITVPILAGVSAYPLLEIESLVNINIAPNTPGELITENGQRTSFADLARQNRFSSNEAGHQITLGQGEMVRVGFQGDLINVYVRYVPETPKPLVAPFLDLTTTEITGIALAILVSAIFGIYMFLYAPSNLNDENRLEEPIRKATVTFRPPRKRIVEMAQKEEKPPEEKKVVKVVEKQKQTKTPSVDKAGTPGKAGEVAPKKTNEKKKQVTSARPGGAIKTSPKKGANMKSRKPDPTKVGLLSVFGSRGAQSKLDKAFSGSGELQGMADQATGYAGDNENRAGDTLGSKIKNTGAGGKGEQTVGISGVGTKGKGTGNYGQGTGGIGTKGNVEINVGGQEAEFVGSMDREAIRRVILNNIRAIRSCYERELQRRPDMYGKLVL